MSVVEQWRAWTLSCRAEPLSEWWKAAVITSHHNKILGSGVKVIITDSILSAFNICEEVFSLLLFQYSLHECTCHHRKLWLVSFLFFCLSIERQRHFPSSVGGHTPHIHSRAAVWSCASVTSWQLSPGASGGNRWLVLAQQQHPWPGCVLAVE